MQRVIAQKGSGGEAVAIDADGHATALRGVGAMVLVADCLPVVLGSEGAVAALHAGWRGLAAGVLEEGVRALRELGGEGEIAAVIGPGAGPCCYEVGEEVHAAFGDRSEINPHRDGRNLDLPGLARERLEAAGVAHVEDVGVCTICDERLFSHRREGLRAGRQAACGVAELIADVDAERVRENLALCARADRPRRRPRRTRPRRVQVLAATKYIAPEDLPALAEPACGSWGRTAPRICRRRSPPMASSSRGTSSASCRAAACR